MNVLQILETKIQTLQPQHVAIVNESGNHNVPPGSQSHFKITLVSASFNGLSLVQRHRMIYDLLEEELRGPIHALALHLYTDEEWQNNNSVSPDSPPCKGGSKLERVT